MQWYPHLPYFSAAKPRLPDDFEAKTWARLQDAVQAVHQKRPVSCSLEELYRVRIGCKPSCRYITW